MTPISPVSQANAVGRSATFLGRGPSLFASKEEKELAQILDTGLEKIERGLERELKFSDEIADAVARYLYSAGGKRIRPLLMMLTAQWGAGVTEKVVRAAQVIELTHIATLYHDDVMDESAQRRGVPAAHTVWGNSMAILAGDLLFARAASLGGTLGQKAIDLQTATFERLCLGQMRETVGPKPGQDPIAHYLKVLSDKTGSLIALASEFGIEMAGGPEQYVGPLRQYGEKLGIAFQLIDDVIDLAPKEAETGKLPGTDVKKGVTTLPVLYLQELSAQGDDEAGLLLANLSLGSFRETSDEEFLSYIDALREHPATVRTVETARSLAEAAVRELDPIPDDIVKEGMIQFAHQVVERTY